VQNKVSVSRYSLRIGAPLQRLKVMAWHQQSPIMENNTQDSYFATIGLKTKKFRKEQCIKQCNLWILFLKKEALPNLQ